MEVNGPLKHPAQEHVKKLVQRILSKSRRKVAVWHVEMLDYDFYTGTYNARLQYDDNSALAKIPAEWIDKIYGGDDHFRLKIKRALRKTVEHFYEWEMD